MKNNYAILRKLIGLWEEYEEQGGEEDLQKFGEWMAAATGKKTVSVRRKTINPFNARHQEYFNRLDQKSRFLELVSRISRLQDFYYRKFLSSTPLNSRLEFLVLDSVKLLGPAKKTDLAHLHLVEFTTAMDMIKRLIGMGLIAESENPDDRRTKLLTITTKGEAELDKARHKIREEIAMMLSCVDENKWKKVMPALEEIHEFHQQIYLLHPDKNDAELLNLVASLKYLYK